MREILIILAILAILLLSWLFAAMPWSTVLSVGGGLSAVGMAIGVPAGVIYHLLLRKELADRGDIPKGWVWKPTSFHNEISQSRRRIVLGWFLLGGIGFVMVVLGIFSVVASMVGSVFSGAH